MIKKIRKYSGIYEVDEKGNVFSVERIVKRKGKIGDFKVKRKEMKTRLIGNGYKALNLHKDKKMITFYVHQIVASHFLKKIGKKEVNHKDGNKLNNDVSNLEWCSHSENGLHAFRTGLRKRVGNKYGTRPYKPKTKANA